MRSRIFLFSLENLLRYRKKSLFIFVVFTVLVFFLTTFFLANSSFEKSLIQKAQNLPHITLSNTLGGRFAPIDSIGLENILQIDGVLDAQLRVYGEYRFLQNSITLIGVDSFEARYDQQLAPILKNRVIENGTAMISTGLQKILLRHHYKGFIPLFTPKLQKVVLKTVQTFESNELLTICTKQDAQKILGYENEKYTDIAIYLQNREEMMQVIKKLQLLYPNGKITTQIDQINDIRKRFSFGSSLFLTLLVVSLFTFFMIVYDRLSGLSSIEKKEVGILKAIGWRVEDILQVKFYEAFLIAFFGSFIGVVAGFILVFGVSPSFLYEIFELEEGVELSLIFEPKPFLVVFALSIPLYIASVIFPTWRLSTRDVDEVIR